MFAINGITGKVGGAAARALLKAGHPVRAVVRDRAKAAAWEALGVELAVAEASDAAALTRAYEGTAGIFVMVPPNFSPDANYTQARAVSAAQVQAIGAAGVPRVVALSSIGSEQGSGLGLITQTHILEQALAALSVPTAILRPGWFMENSLWDIAPARDTGVLGCFLQPLERAHPMVATQDIGRVVADTLLQSWQGRRVIEIEGPRRYSQLDVAEAMGRAVGRSVVAQTVPHDTWEALFKAGGTERPAPRIEMVDGFNTGWIAFDPKSGNEHVTGTTSLDAVLAQLANEAR